MAEIPAAADLPCKGAAQSAGGTVPLLGLGWPGVPGSWEVLWSAGLASNRGPYAWLPAWRWSGAKGTPTVGL